MGFDQWTVPSLVRPPHRPRHLSRDLIALGLLGCGDSDERRGVRFVCSFVVFLFPCHSLFWLVLCLVDFFG